MKKNKTKKALATLAIAGMAVTMVPFNAFASGVTTDRLAGSDRIGTAVQVAQKGWTTADTAILAPSADANLVDALAAAPLAGSKAPILLTDKNTLSAAAQTELTTLGVKNVYVVGAISQAVVDQVNALPGVKATVLKGADRIGTAAQISAKLTAPAGSFVVGYGALADALSVASFAAANNYSILVANPDGSLPASEKALLSSKVYIIGGPTLVADIAGATRLYGADRFATNQQVLNNLTYQYNKVYVANGTSGHLVDSLVASSLAAQANAPIVLGDTTGAKAAVSVHAKLAANAVVTALGGPAVVPDAVVNQVVSGTTPVPPPSQGEVTISNVTVSGQTVGDGSTNSPAVAAINNAVTVNATIAGANTANSTVTYLVSNSTNITAKDANGNTLPATTLTSPIIIGNDTYKATYSVPADASGNVSIAFSSTASSSQAFNVVIQAPFYSNGQPVRSKEVRAQWGVPGTMVLSPIYTSGSPDNLNFSNGANPTNGLIPVVATYLPADGSTTTNSGQAVKFTMTASSVAVNSGATAFFTDSSGASTVGQNSSVGGNANSTDTTPKVATAYYNVTTDSKGQALVYINANQPSTNSVANLGASITVGVQAQLVNGGGTTSQGYYKWQSVAQATQIANLSPSQMLNPTGLSDSTATPVVSTAAETATSGSQITISGTVQDAAGNPVPNVTIAMQDYDATDTTQSSNNIQNDAFVTNGTTTLFSATNYPVVTTDSSGNFSFLVTANIPVTQSVYNSQTKYYVYYVPNTVSLASGQSLPTSGITKLTFVGNSNAGSYINLVWQQGQTVQAVGVGTGPLLSQYDKLADVPTSNQSFTKVIGDNQKVYVAGFNQNGQMVAPTSASDSSNQFAGYGTDFNITLPSGMKIMEFGNGDSSDPTINSYLAGTAVYQAELRYYQGALYLVAVNNTTLTSSTALVGPVQVKDAAAYDGSGQLMFRVVGTGTSSTSGAINATVSAYSGIKGAWDTTNAQGAGSSSITGNFTAASAITSLGVTSSVGNLINYGPLRGTNAAPGNTNTVSGTAFDGFDTVKNASFVASAFNNYVSISPIPTQGLTYTLTATKNGKFRQIDGFTLQSAPQIVNVNIQNNGLVSVNNTAIWSVPSGSTVVGYSYVPATSTTGTLYVLGKANGTTNFTLYTVSGNTSLPTTHTWAVPGSDPAGYEGYLGFNIDSSGNLSIMDNADGWGVTSSSPSAGAPAGLIAPVQAITAGVSDKYSETPVVTITNSVNSQTATVTANYTSGTGLSAVNESPSSVNFVSGSSQNVTLTAVDLYGNPLANQTIYIQGTDKNVNGLWITQINGTAIQTLVNLAATGTNSNFQNVNAPVPLFVYSSEGLTQPAYGTLSIAGSISAYNLNNGSTPYVALVTGTDGTVKFTVQDGNVQYWAQTGGATATNPVDPGAKIAGKLYFYGTTADVVAGTNALGSINVNVN